jgi:hypothetical protein
VPAPTTTGLRKIRSSSIRLSSIIAAASPAPDRDVLVGRVKHRSYLLGHRRLGEPGIALNRCEGSAEDGDGFIAPDR